VGQLEEQLSLILCATTSEYAAAFLRSLRAPLRAHMKRVVGHDLDTHAPAFVLLDHFRKLEQR
jgi:hypothetical protein